MRLGVRQWLSTILLVLGALAGMGAGLVGAEWETSMAGDWEPYPANLFKPDLGGDNLERQWPYLVRATGDSWPTEPVLQDAWRAHFQGDFAEAHRQGLALGTPVGKYVAYRAQTIYALYMTDEPVRGEEAQAERTSLLKEAADQLSVAIQTLENEGQEPSPQLLFWRAYAQGRYVQIMKAHWGVLTKKSSLEELLSYVDRVVEPPVIPALHSLFGSLYSAVYHEGYAARLAFRSYLKDYCVGKPLGVAFAQAVFSQFDCALKQLGTTPFPELYNSYGRALLELDSVANRDRAETFFQYASGASIPSGVTNMIFSAEDALAREAVKKRWPMDASDRLFQ